jgi:hypothetical protein
MKKDEQFRKIVEDLVSQIDSGLAPPTVWDTVGVAALKLPLTVVKEGPFQLSWFIKHNIQGQPYSDDEKRYLMKKSLGDEWDSYSAADQKSLMEAGAWEADKMAAWRKKGKKLR